MDLQALFQNTANTTILTPNRRLSATLHQAYQQFQTAKGLTAWPTLSCLPAINFIESLWQQAPEDILLLNTAQELVLWEQIIAADKENAMLLQLSGTAELARSAWGLMQQWELTLSAPAFQTSPDYTAFYNWAQAFQELCKNKKWITNNALTTQVTHKILKGEIILPKKIILLGFNEISPQMQHWLEGCRAANTLITLINKSDATAICKRTPMPDQTTEILAMAEFAKAKQKEYPGSTIGCVIPALDKIRDQVQQIFSQVFASENTFTVDINTCPFNLSAGKSLANYPIIKAALAFLNLQKNHLSITQLGALLSSPFIGDAEAERIKRIHYESKCRRANTHHIRLSRLLDNNHPLTLSQYCPHLAKRLSAFLKLADTHTDKYLLSKWAHYFIALLEQLGWPGERSLNSEEYQTVENWLKCLQQYMTLDYICDPLNYHDALQQLIKLTYKQSFQIQTPVAPIQVLGTLEAASLPFDYLWVSGMDDLSWPPQPKPHPFIPKEIQRQLHMPHATAERELEYCNTLLMQFKTNAKEIMFSYTQKQDDIELQVSPLISDIPEVSTPANSATPSERIYNSRALHTIHDEQGPALAASEKVYGGTAIIKSQALCPFKAFAEWRLHAHPLDSTLPGIRARDRGSLLHKILELFWNITHDHATLVTLSETELQARINECITQAMTMMPLTENKNYGKLEHQRLFKLVNHWLALEKMREPFKVLAHEKRAEIQLNDLKFNIRVDRIDALEDGSHMIIDYKTSKYNEVSKLFSDRPEEPQLALYTTLAPTTTQAISFAQVTTGSACFKGVSDKKLAINGIKPLTAIKHANATSWEEQIQEWQGIFNQLAKEFSAGIAEINPKDEQICVHCQLQSLCRIKEANSEVATYE